MDSDDQNRFPKGIANSSPILKPQPRREQCRTYIAPTRKPFPPTMRTREPIGIVCNACIIAPDAFTSSARHRTTRSSPLGRWYDTRSQQRVGIRFPRLRSRSVGARPVWLTHIKLIFLSEKLFDSTRSPQCHCAVFAASSQHPRNHALFLDLYGPSVSAVAHSARRARLCRSSAAISIT